MFIYVYMHARIYACMCLCVCIFVQEKMHEYTYMCIYMYVRIYMYVYQYICLNIYMYKFTGSEEVLSRVKRMQSLADEAVEDERIAKDAKKRENLEAAQSKKKNNNLNIIIPDRDWSTSDLEVLDTAIKRYPAGNVSRWLSITHYVNDKLLSPEAFAKASSSISQDECLRAAFTAAH
jgi:hypothetical protein